MGFEQSWQSNLVVKNRPGECQARRRAAGNIEQYSQGAQRRLALAWRGFSAANL
jgi:hypothetical protein